MECCTGGFRIIWFYALLFFRGRNLGFVVGGGREGFLEIFMKGTVGWKLCKSCVSKIKNI